MSTTNFLKSAGITTRGKDPLLLDLLEELIKDNLLWNTSGNYIIAQTKNSLYLAKETGTSSARCGPRPEIKLSLPYIQLKDPSVAKGKITRGKIFEVYHHYHTKVWRKPKYLKLYPL
jgi:hypothetical protein